MNKDLPCEKLEQTNTHESQAIAFIDLMKSVLERGIICGRSAENSGISRFGADDQVPVGANAIHINVILSKKEIESAIHHPAKGALPVALERQNDQLTTRISEVVELTEKDLAEVKEEVKKHFGGALPPRDSPDVKEALRLFSKLKDQALFKKSLTAFQTILSERAHQSFLVVIKSNEVYFTNDDGEKSLGAHETLNGHINSKKDAEWEEREPSCGEARVSGNVAPQSIYRCLLSFPKVPQAEYPLGP